jgi:hypothetical protein
VLLDPEAAAMLDEQTGRLTSGGGNKNTGNRDNGRTIGHGLGAGDGDGIGGDSGGASRFFYVATPDHPREAAGDPRLGPGSPPSPSSPGPLPPSPSHQTGGDRSREPDAKCPPASRLDHRSWPETVDPASDASRFFYVAKASSVERNAGLEGRNAHPTVKPIALMRWLVRLVTPPGGLVLDPFAGSGTTGIACALEGLSFIGVEREADYVAIARARMRWWGRRDGGETKAVLRALKAEDARQLELREGAT